MAETQDTKSDFIFIEWTGLHILHIDAPVFLVPGVNRLESAFWALHRQDLLDRIVESSDGLSEEDKKAGRIIERFASVETKVEQIAAKRGPGGVVLEPSRTEAVTTVKAAKDIADIEPFEAANLVRRIFDPKLLEEINLMPLDASVLAAARTQLAEIEKKNKKKAS